MNIHSCQSMNRKKRLPIANIKKVCVPCSIQRRQSLRSPLNQTRDRSIQTFSFSNCQIPGSLFSMWGVVHTPYTPGFSLLCLHFPQHFCPFSGLCFPQPHFLPHRFLPAPQNTLPTWVPFVSTITGLSLHYPCPHCQALLSTYTHIFTWSTWHRSPGRSKHLPKGRDDSVLVAHLLTGLSVPQTWAAYAWSAGFPLPQQATFPLHCSASCKAEICIFWACIDWKTSNIFCGIEP